MVKAVDRLRGQGTLRQMQRATKQILKAAGPSGGETCRRPRFIAQTGRHILRQVDELLQHQDSLADPDERERHHPCGSPPSGCDTRWKLPGPCIPDRLDEAVDAIKRVQSLLGEVHDCDVWAEHLDAFAAKECGRITALFGHAGRFTRLQPGIDFLRADRYRRRQEVFRQLVEYWGELARGQFWDRLVSVVLSRGRPSPGGTAISAQPPSVVPTEVAPPAVIAAASLQALMPVPHLSVVDPALPQHLSSAASRSPFGRNRNVVDLPT